MDNDNFKKTKSFKAKLNFLIIFLFVLGIEVFGFNSKVKAAEYYVAPKDTATQNMTDEGSIAWNNAQDINTPTSAQTAMVHAVAGDTVYFLDGVYIGLKQRSPVEVYREPALFPRNNGTLNNPIIFKALNRGNVELRGYRNTSDMARVAVIGSNGATSQVGIIWDGFVITAYNNSMQIMGGINLYYAQDVTVTYCEIVGVTHSLGGAYNIEGIRIEHSSDININNCNIHGWKESSHNHNTSGIKSYSSSDVAIHNNNLYDNYIHIYIKGGYFENWKVYNNYSEGGDMAVLYTLNSDNKVNMKFYNNLFANCINVFGDDGGTLYTSDNFYFYNNTLIFVATGLQMPQASSALTAPIVYNNIFYALSPNRTLVTRRNGESRLKECDHNVYYTSIHNLLDLYDTNREYVSMTTWQESGELVNDNNPGVGSMVTDPLFVNGSGTMSQLDDFKLSQSSPCRGTGRNGGDIGANIDLIGIQSTSTQSRADVDNNSQINTTDAMLTLRNSLGLDMSGTNWQTSTTTGDVNCDNTTNSTDAMLILRYSLGLSMEGTGWCI